MGGDGSGGDEARGGGRDRWCLLESFGAGFVSNESKDWEWMLYREGWSPDNW